MRRSGCRVEALAGVLTDRIKHLDARFSAGIVVLVVRSLLRFSQKVLVDERLKDIQHIRGDARLDPGERFGRLNGTAAGEDPELDKEVLLSIVKQVVAPINGRAQGLLAERKCSGAAGDDGE